MLRVGLVVAGIVALAVAPAAARPYVRVELGPDGLSSRYQKQDGSESVVSGRGAGVVLAVGTTVAPRWSLFGELFHHAIDDASQRNGGNTYDFSHRAIAVGGLAIGGAYHLDGSRASLAVGLASWGETDEDDEADNTTTRAGPILLIEVGHDFRVSEHVSLGFAVRLFATKAPVANGFDEAVMHTKGASVALAGTYR